MFTNNHSAVIRRTHGKRILCSNNNFLRGISDQSIQTCQESLEVYVLAATIGVRFPEPGK